MSRRRTDIEEQPQEENSISGFFKNKYYLHAYLCILIPIVLIGYFVLDPDLGIISNASYGTVFINTLRFVMFAVVAAGVLWLTAVAFTDYGKYGNIEKLAEKATQEPLSTSIYILAINLKWVAIAIVLSGAFSVMR